MRGRPALSRVEGRNPTACRGRGLQVVGARGPGVERTAPVKLLTRCCRSWSGGLCGRLCGIFGTLRRDTAASAGPVPPRADPVSFLMASVAQLAEHRIVDPGVVGSIPIVRPEITTYFPLQALKSNWQQLAKAEPIANSAIGGTVMTRGTCLMILSVAAALSGAACTSQHALP